MISSLKKYFWNILISIDQLINTIFAGDPDETLSIRMGKSKSNCKICYLICKLLSIIDKRHCEKSIETDEGKDEI